MEEDGTRRLVGQLERKVSVSYAVLTAPNVLHVCVLKVVVFAWLTRARFGVGRVNTCPFVGVEGGLVVYGTLDASMMAL